MILVVLGFRAAYDHFRTSQNSFGRSLGFGVMGAMVAMVVQGFVEFQIAFTQFGVLFWMLLGLLVASASLQRKSVVSAAVPSGPGA
jgi:FtsH-binding integral membrane protein